MNSETIFNNSMCFGQNSKVDRTMAEHTSKSSTARNLSANALNMRSGDRLGAEIEAKTFLNATAIKHVLIAIAIINMF